MSLRSRLHANSSGSSNLRAPGLSSNKKATNAVASQEEFPSSETKTNDVISEAVLHGLSHFGGADVVESLVYILELEHSVDLRSVSTDLNKLRGALKAMFGAASYVVEERICANLAKTLGLDPDGRSLEELTQEARNRIKSQYLREEEGGASKISK